MNAIVFALELEVAGKTYIRINPFNFILRNIKENKIHVYVTCEDKSVIDKIAKFDMTVEEAVFYRKQEQSESKFSMNDDVDELSDEEDAKSFYHLISEQSLLTACKNNLEGSRLVTGHIIICGMHTSLPSFILPLRAKNLEPEQEKYIVILTPEPPSLSLWEKLSTFPKLFIVLGSPLNVEDLKRADINYGSKAVI